MIKIANNLNDIKDAIELLGEFLQSSAYSETVKIDIDSLGRICGMAQRGGAVWLAYQDQKPAGVLIAFLEPNMWNLNQRHLREICWYVRPEYRSSSLGGRLFKKYQEFAENMLKNGLIDAYFTTQMSSTEPIDLERRGFKFIERTYVKERV